MTAKSTCVHCGETVSEWTQDCPKCGRPVANPDAPIVSDLRSKFKTSSKYRKKSSLPIIIGIAIVLIIIAIYFSMS